MYRVVSLFWLSVTLVFLLASGCDDTKLSDDKNHTESAEDRQAMLRHFYDNILVPSYSEMVMATSELSAAFDAFESAHTPENFEALRTAFMAAYLHWQTVAFYNFGYAADHAFIVQINHFPAKTDAIDDFIDAGEAYSPSLSNYGSGGFPALDYLLYAPVTPLDANNSSVSALAYTKSVIVNIDTLIKASFEDIQANKTTFVNSLGLDVGSSIGRVYNGFSQYLEKYLRDAKVAIPLGIRSQETILLKNVEGRFSKSSQQLLLKSLVSIRDFYTGTAQDGKEGASFLTLLASTGYQLKDQSLSEKMKALYDAAVLKTQSFDTTIEAAITKDKTDVSALHQTLQQIVALTKTDMASALGITVSYNDNDGD